MAHQLPLPNMPSDKGIVNVASVPQRSPFRYPGGKTWLVPRIRAWLYSLPQKPAHFVEPFAGGAIIGLTVAAERLAEHVTLVELDEQVAVVWQLLIHGDVKDVEWLAESILRFELTSEAVEQLLTAEHLLPREQALRTIVKNRVNRGGILAPGAGRLKHGENGRGISSRWYPRTLHKRIMNILRLRDRLTFIHGDAFDVIAGKLAAEDTVFFIDPPYTAGGKRAGRRLYNYWDIDHERLFSLSREMASDFLMTYSNSEEVRHLAESHGFDVEPVAMKSTHHAEMTELLVGRDLAWARES